MANLIISENNTVTLTPDQAKALTQVNIAGNYENAVLLSKYLGFLSVPIPLGTQFDEVLHTEPAYYLAISLEGLCFTGVGVPKISESGDSWEFKYPILMTVSQTLQLNTLYIVPSRPS